MEYWWKSLAPKQQVAVIVAMIGAIGGISLALNVNVATGKNTIISNDGIQHSGTGDDVKGDKIVNIGITLAEYEQRLKSREAEIRAELKKSHAKDRQLLEAELRNTEQALQDTKASHEALVKSLKERIAQLEAQRGEWPDKILDEAIEALQSGNTEKADRLFQQVEDDSEKHIKRAAEAAYQRSKIAEDRIRYADALKHYENAIRLQPENGLYLNGAGILHRTLANYQKAIEYLELALASVLKTFGENHPDVAATRNNLGGAWHSLGEYHKAIEYLELALASVLKTFGEHHPAVARDRNNLGDAWIQLGKYHKAIEYLELALDSKLKTFGENHPSVATTRNNLGDAWIQLGKYHKAIDYYKLALAGYKKSLGENHPFTRIVQTNLEITQAKMKSH